MLGECLADAIRRIAEYRNGPPEKITREWTQRPYLTRWLVARKTDALKPGQKPEDAPRRSIFLHHFQDSDADEMHDHPLELRFNHPVRGILGTHTGEGLARREWTDSGTLVRRRSRSDSSGELDTLRSPTSRQPG